MQADWALVQWFPWSRGQSSCSLLWVSLIAPQDNGQSPEGAMETRRPQKDTAAPLLPTHHGDGTPAGANDAGPGVHCSSLSDASERCPHSGLCGLGAHSWRGPEVGAGEAQAGWEGDVRGVDVCGCAGERKDVGLALREARHPRGSYWLRGLGS